MTSLRAIPLRHHLTALLLFASLVTLAFATRWVHGQKMLFEVIWDPIPVQLFYPGDRIEAAAFSRGQLALWDPYRGFGSRLIMPTAVTLGHPLKQMAFLWGTDTGFEFMLMLRLILAGFFTWLLARGMGLSHPAGLLAGIGYMFCGYFRQFYNFLDLNVEMTYPLALLFLIRLMRDLKLVDFLGFLWSGYFVLSGGNPESMYDLFGPVLVSAVYAITERLCLRKGKFLAVAFPRMFMAIFFFVGFHALICIWEPSVEVIFRGWTFHFAGLGKLHFDLNHLVALFTPSFDPWLSLPRGVKGQLALFTPIPSYLGLFLGSLALFSVFQFRNSRRTLAFFWFFTILMLGLLFGIPGFSWFLALPFINRLQNFRYYQPILALLVSVLAGFGFEQIRKGRKLKTYFLILAVLALWLTGHAIRFRAGLTDNSPMFMVVGLLIVSLAGLSLIFLWRRPFSGKLLAGIVFVFATAELFLCFVLITPFYGPEAFKIQKPAFLDRLKRDTHQYRFYSPDKDILPPNTASLWGLRDLRDGATLLPREYYRFFSALNHWQSQEQAVEAFLERGWFYLPLELERIPGPTLDLLFKYLLTNSRLGSQSLLANFSAGSLRAPRPHFFSAMRYELKGKSRNALLLHPPARLRGAEKIPPGELVLETGLLEPPDSKSDGAEFILRGADASGERLFFYRFLPEPGAPGWREYRVPISEPAALELATLAGPRANDFQDYALFGSLEAAGPPNPGYRLLDDAGPFVYERPAAVPRFFIARGVEWVKDQDQALARVRREDLSVAKTFLTGVAPAGEKAEMAGSAGPDRIRLWRDETDRVELELNLGSPAWLIMADSFICGWKAELDGREQKIYPADYYFRAVYVPAGGHRLKFFYHPESFRIGLFKNLSFFLAAILFALVLGFRNSSRRRAFFPSRAPRD